MKVIITGATGMVGEGVLLSCLANNDVTEILMVNRRNYQLTHPKLKEILVPDFLKLENKLTGYDACFFCAGISSVGMNEEKFTLITYTTTLHFAKELLKFNPQMVFTYVSGAGTNINGAQMWQKVKGRTEAELNGLGFRGEYNFRPGFMTPYKGQKNVKWFFRPLIALLKPLIPKYTLTMDQVGKAMVNVVKKPYPSSVLEVADIKKGAENNY